MSTISASQQLALDYLPLAKSLARLFAAKIPREADEFRSVAFIALCESAARFDPDRGINFATFARPHILGALNDYCRTALFPRIREWPIEGHRSPRGLAMATTEAP